MNRKHLLSGLPAVVAASALVLLLIACGNQNNVPVKEEEPGPPLPPLCKSIPEADLQNQLKSIGSDRAVASVYPIKRSSDMKRKDFDMVIVLHDGRNTVAGQPVDPEKFEKEAGYYVQYMKRQQVRMEEVPRSYNALLRRQDGKAVQGLEVCLELTRAKATFDLAGSHLVDFPSLRLDSAGKCPPECPNPPEVYEQAMLRTIKKIYQ
jgi:hypothetical protein